jgi:hypothetical protein
MIGTALAFYTGVIQVKMAATKIYLSLKTFYSWKKGLVCYTSCWVCNQIFV